MATKNFIALSLEGSDLTSRLNTEGSRTKDRVISRLRKVLSKPRVSVPIDRQIEIGGFGNYVGVKA